MRTLLHIGMTKAGSSALQDALRRSPEALAARGLLYPRNPPRITYINHALLLAAICDWRPNRSMQFYPDGGGLDLAAETAAFVADLRATVAATPPRGLILSAEHLFRVLPDPGPARLPALLAELGGATTVIAYLRRPSEHYLSDLQQHLKGSFRVKPPRPPRYRRVLESYAGIFGDAALSISLYHRPALVDGDIVADFAARHLGAFGVTRADLATPRRTNRTISAESIDVLQRFRAAFHGDRDNRKSRDTNALVVALREVDAATDAPRPRLRASVAARVDAACADALWLRDRHGIVFPDFDYRGLEAGGAPKPAPKSTPISTPISTTNAPALEDILEIDRARERAVLAALRAAPWAGKRARRIWIDGLLAELA